MATDDPVVYTADDYEIHPKPTMLSVSVAEVKVINARAKAQAQPSAVAETK